MNVYLCISQDRRDPVVTSTKDLAFESFKATFRSKFTDLSFQDRGDITSVLALNLNGELTMIGHIRTLVVHDNFVCF